MSMLMAGLVAALIAVLWLLGATVVVAFCQAATRGDDAIEMARSRMVDPAGLAADRDVDHAPSRSISRE